MRSVTRNVGDARGKRGVTRVNERERVVVRMLADVEPARGRAYDDVEAVSATARLLAREMKPLGMDGRARSLTDARACSSGASTRRFAAATARAVRELYREDVDDEFGARGRGRDEEDAEAETKATKADAWRRTTRKPPKTTTDATTHPEKLREKSFVSETLPLLKLGARHAAAAYGSLAALLENNSARDKAHGLVRARYAYDHRLRRRRRRRREESHRARRLGRARVARGGYRRRGLGERSVLAGELRGGGPRGRDGGAGHPGHREHGRPAHGRREHEHAVSGRLGAQRHGHVGVPGVQDAAPGGGGGAGEQPGVRVPGHRAQHGRGRRGDPRHARAQRRRRRARGGGEGGEGGGCRGGIRKKGEKLEKSSAVARNPRRRRRRNVARGVERGG